VHNAYEAIFSVFSTSALKLAVPVVLIELGCLAVVHPAECLSPHYSHHLATMFMGGFLSISLPLYPRSYDGRVRTSLWWPLSEAQKI